MPLSANGLFWVLNQGTLQLSYMKYLPPSKTLRLVSHTVGSSCVWDDETRRESAVITQVTVKYDQKTL